MKKRLLSLGLAAMMALSLAGCGGSGSAGSSDSTGAEEAKTEEKGAVGEVFVLGGIGPLTGSAAAYGESVKNGIELAVNEINEAGGINGYQVEYYFEDDENDAEKAVNAYNTLKDKGIQMLVGTVTSKPCIAVGAESAVDNMFQLTPSRPVQPFSVWRMTMYSAYASLTRIRERNLPSILQSMASPQRLPLSTTAPASTLTESANPS